MDSTVYPLADSSPAAVASVSASTSNTTRFAPSPPSSSAHARPMPCAPPMTSAVLPSNRPTALLRVQLAAARAGATRIFTWSPSGSASRSMPCATTSSTPIRLVTIRSTGSVPAAIWARMRGVS